LLIKHVILQKEHAGHGDSF